MFFRPLVILRKSAITAGSRLSAPESETQGAETTRFFSKRPDVGVLYNGVFSWDARLNSLSHLISGPAERQKKQKGEQERDKNRTYLFDLGARLPPFQIICFSSTFSVKLRPDIIGKRADREQNHNWAFFLRPPEQRGAGNIPTDKKEEEE